jgi:cytidine deaminase
MTILEELIDAAMKICENSRASGQLQTSRAAVLLSATGKVYVGCDVRLPNSSESQTVSAERAAFLSAIADGASKFEVFNSIHWWLHYSH